MHKGKIIKIHNDNIPYTLQAAGFSPRLCKYVITLKLGLVFGRGMCVCVRERGGEGGRVRWMWERRVIYRNTLTKQTAECV